MAIEPLVLAVDDEPGILRLINLVLSNNGFRVMVAEDGMEALRIAERHRPDLVILDVRMPQMGGIEVMRKLRERITTPIILLTAKSNDEDKIFGLESGADDYLVKPFNPGELSARARAVIRRSHHLPGNGTTVRADGVEIDLDRRLVTKDGQLVPLTRTEWRLLQELATNAGRVMLNAELLSSVWGSEYRDDLQYLRVWISRLRSKIERVPSEPKILVTFPGIGYMFTSEGSHSGNGNGSGNHD
ncbi:MAG TPA: response regulator transcription factor [Dehalococcoidia bacterium]|nr:response regulator transcription factor [Dehalococcoidia bacterium]